VDATLKYFADFLKDNEVCHYGNCFLVNFLDCHTTLTQPHGEITSYGFPEGYYHNMDCTWLIQRPNGEVIEISFTSFDVGSDFSYFACR
jgi:hypothetical protein